MPSVAQAGPVIPRLSRTLNRWLSLWLTFCLCRADAAPVRIIFDTDMHTDCDDAGALAVLHALADRGEAEIVACMVSTLDPWAAPTVDAINTYYDRPDVPIGGVKGAGVLRKSPYTKAVATTFPHDVEPSGSIPDAVQLYRQLLEKEADAGVMIVTVGYLTNIQRLLSLPAAEGRLSGGELARRKVKQWVCMGGNFIGNPPRDDLRLGNVNFTYDKQAALDAIRGWPGTLVFAGREVCSVPSGLQLGASLARTPRENPVRAAYEAYFGGVAKDRHVADLVTVLYAVRGLRDYWDLEERGVMRLREDVTFEWDYGQESEQAFLRKKLRDGKPNDRYIEQVLDELLVQPPRSPPAAKPRD